MSAPVKGGLLILGDTGLAGAALMQAARARGLTVTGASRRGEVALDLTDADAVARTLSALSPRLIINTAAQVSLAACEADPGAAWMINARPAALIAGWARTNGARVVHISTDHFYSGDGRKAHAEADPVVLLNDYARTKYAAEGLALAHADTLVVRTNILGLKSATGGSFGEWALGVIRNDAEATLFDDQFVSILDIWSFAEGVLDLAATDAAGVINLAASEVFSKAELVEALAAAMGRTLTRAKRGSVGGLDVPRAGSLGLDGTRAEALLGRRLPGLSGVVQAVAHHAKEAAHALGH